MTITFYCGDRLPDGVTEPFHQYQALTPARAIEAVAWSRRTGIPISLRLRDDGDMRELPMCSLQFERGELIEIFDYHAA